MTTRELSSHTHGDDNGRGLNNYMSTRGKKLNLEDHGIYRHYVKGFGKAYVWFLEEHLSEEDLAKAKRKRRKEERAAKAAAKSTSPTEEPAQPQSTEEHTDQMPTLY